tara:strand:+ start:43 stop:798 length:756 start_codon:yes stop_codon:yes gene_type:complete
MAVINSRDTLADYCKRNLGEPVIEVNIDEDQVSDRIDEALEVFREFHSDATHRTYLKHQVTQDDLDNNFITVPDSVHIVSRLLPLSNSINSSTNMFSVKYQMMLNDIADLQNFAGDLAYYNQMQQYLNLIDMQLNGKPLVQFSRHQHRLHILGDLNDGDIKKDEFIILEVYQIIDPNSFTSVFNDKFVKEYTTQLFKRQWGTNLIKFEGMQLPGGVQLNGRQLYDDAVQELQRLREEIRLEHEMPPDFFMG